MSSQQGTFQTPIFPLDPDAKYCLLGENTMLYTGSLRSWRDLMHYPLDTLNIWILFYKNPDAKSLLSGKMLSLLLENTGSALYKNTYSYFRYQTFII